MACLTRQASKEFLDAIRKGEITPEKMLSATSKERQAMLEKVVGKENVEWVNAALESKILLKDQNRGMVTWAKKVSGISEPARRDLLSAIQKQTKVFDPATSSSFLESLAAKRFGHEISFEEAKNVSELANKEKDLKAAVKDTDPIRSKSRMEYGAAVATFKDYVGHLKLTAGEVGPTWYLKHPVQSIVRSAGVAKSLVSTLDNSFFGRQGLKMLLTNPDIWSKGFAKSWVDIGKELAGRDAMFAIKSDVFSRPGAIDGKYNAMKLDIGLGSEEAFPSHILTKIPGLGRLASAAESAFNGAALRFRADYADRVIREAEQNGQDMLNPAHAEPLGRIVNAMTGRGNIGKLDAYGKQINATIFSVKFLKSNFDTLTAHQFQKDITPQARKVAAMNLAKIVGSISGVLTIANLLHPGSVELDPRSSKFGKIQIGDTTFDVTGGMAGLVTLAARMVPTMHNGKWSWYTKSATGEFRELGTGKFGSKDAMDVFYDFWRGKLAPYAALISTMVRGKDFQGRQAYVEGHRLVPTVRTVVGAHAPIPLQNFEETMSNPNAASPFWTTLADELGISANTYSPKKAAPKLPGGSGLGGSKRP